MDLTIKAGADNLLAGTMKIDPVCHLKRTAAP
jgi:hypothetical protein